MWHVWGIGAYMVSVGKREVMRPLGRPSHRWEDNIKMDLKKKMMRSWTGLILLRVGASGELL